MFLLKLESRSFSVHYIFKLTFVLFRALIPFKFFIKNGMRQYIHSDKKWFGYTLLLFCIVAAFLTPSVHCHDLKHDVGNLHDDLALKVAPAHNHVEHHTGQSHGEPGANCTDFSRHDHSSNQHSHFLENLPLRAQRGVRGLETHKSFSLQAVRNNLAFKKVSSEIFHRFSPITPLSNLEFIFVATSLPPPIV